jgi:hypothetical protein
MYQCSYTGNAVQMIPTTQNAPEPPRGDLKGGVSTTFELTLNNGLTNSFKLTAVNGTLMIEANDDGARSALTSGDKDTEKMILAVSVLKAVQDLNQIPDQITAVFMSKN